jgi:hypothetical protein
VTGPRELPYKLLRKRRGMTTGFVEYRTPITGHAARIHREVGGKWVHCELMTNGLLLVYPETTWDFGTGAIDTPDVVRASLAHDMFCHFTNLGLIPWECRKVADNYYRDLLIYYGCTKIRANAHWLVVRSNSKFNAYWSRQK